MPKQVNVSEAETQLSKLLEEVEGGDEIVDEVELSTRTWKPREDT